MDPDDEVIMIALGKLVAISGGFMGRLDLIANEFEANGVAASVRTYQVLGLTFGLSVIFVLLVSSALYLLLSRRQKALQIASTLAAGDLSSRIDTSDRYGDGQLMQALQGMNGNLQTIVGEVRRSTSAIAQASEQIAAGNLELTSRTEEQASALEQTSASVEGLRTIAGQNADNAQRASEMATSASAAAVQGGAEVSAVVETMASRAKRCPASLHLRNRTFHTRYELNRGAVHPDGRHIEGGLIACGASPAPALALRWCAEAKPCIDSTRSRRTPIGVALPQPCNDWHAPCLVEPSPISLSGETCAYQ